MVAILVWLCPVYIFFAPLKLLSQIDESNKKKRIEILWAEDLSGYQDSLKGQVRVLTGNVRLKHNQNFLNCDKATQLIDSSLVKAVGNVHIRKPDTLDIYAKQLIYSSETKLAKLRKNVELHDSTGVLYTENLDFDLNNDIGRFWGGGKYVGDSSTLTSNSGVYYNKEKMAYFTGDVIYEKVNGLKMLSDTMKYDTENKIVWFVTQTKIIDGENVINTDTGYYNTKTGDAYFGKNTVMKNKNTKLTAIKIKYSKEKKEGVAVGNAVWQDTVENILILADSIIYQEDSSYVLATRDPLLIDINEKDTFFMSSDTLISYRIFRSDTLFHEEDSTYSYLTDTLKAFKAFNNVKMFRNRFSGVCDSLSYTYVDSIFRFYQNPIMWMDTSQFTSDSVYVYTKNEKTDKVVLYQQSFVISQSHPELYNQIKGRTITAFFEDDSIRRVFVDGNAESIYFIKDDSSAYLGMNKTTSSTIKMHFKGKEIDRIICFEDPEGTFYPMKLTNSSNQKLDGFNWKFELKPKTAYDVIRNQQAYQIEYLDNLFAQKDTEQEEDTEDLEKEIDEENPIEIKDDSGEKVEELEVPK